MRECSSPTTCHMSHVTCHASRVKCQVSCVTCHMSHFSSSFFGQKGEAYRWRVSNQWGLPRLVLILLQSDLPSQGRVCYQQGLPRLVFFYKTLPYARTKRRSAKKYSRGRYSLAHLNKEQSQC